jgi:glyoxylase-like metal-dependent hydrolase (beta-lactamase superfamily II)
MKGLTVLSDGVRFVQAQSNGRYPFANSLLIGDKTRCLVDAGMGNSILGEIIKEGRVGRVVFSHCHEDHTAGSYLLSGAVHCAHALDRDAIESVDKLKERYLVRNTCLEGVFDKFFFESLGLRNCPIEEEIEDGCFIDCGEAQLKVIHTPGHSAGHCSFFEQSGSILFSSDIDLSSFGPWYGCLDSDIPDFISSIRKLMSIKAEMIVSSHKGIIREDIQSKFEVFLDRIFQREKRILEFVENGRTLDEITDRALIYGRLGEPREAYLLFESVMVKKHLEKLLKEGKVVCERGRYFAT